MMADLNQRVQAIESKLSPLKQQAAQLNQMLTSQAAKDYLVGRATTFLDDVESLLRHGKSKDSTHPWLWFDMADFFLAQAERQLKQAQDMIAKYGADLVAIG